MKKATVVSLVAAAMAGMILLAARTRQPAEKFLFVWAGDQSRQSPDFLAVVDFEENSRSYGKVVAKCPLPDPGSAGNEPHHVGLSADGKTLAAGGLLSVLKKQREIFFFDVSNPLAPRFVSSADPPLSAITDEFLPLPNGGFLVTMMGSATGRHPGRIAEFSRDLRLIRELPENPPPDGFNPHGISARPDLNLMVTSDFICPSSTLAGHKGDLLLRGSVRVWNLEERRIVKTIHIPEAMGTIDVQMIPGDRQGRAYTAGMADGNLYLIDTRNGTARGVFAFASIARDGWPHLMRLTRDGKRLFVTMHRAGKVAMFDTSDPERPILLRTVDLGEGSGPHFLALTRDERRLVVTDYFLNEDDAGKVHAEGDHKVHVLRVGTGTLAVDERFSLDFDTAFASGPARPHGVVAR